jgi:hypothetical protein
MGTKGHKTETDPARFVRIAPLFWILDFSRNISPLAEQNWSLPRGARSFAGRRPLFKKESEENSVDRHLSSLESKIFSTSKIYVRSFLLTVKPAGAYLNSRSSSSLEGCFQMPVENHPRRRGRPRGSGKKDLPQLAHLADLLVRDPSLRPTTAMKRIMRGAKDWDASDATLLRRWQVKWKEHGVSLMESARQRARPRPAAFATPANIDREALRVVQEFAEAMRVAENSPYQKALRTAQDLPFEKALRAVQADRLEKALRAVRQLPFEKALMAMVLNSPLAKTFLAMNLLFAPKTEGPQPNRADGAVA